MADTSAFSIPQPASMTPERLAVLMTAVASSRPRDRANVFAPIEAELTLWLSACDTGNREVLAPGRDHERFLAQARTYLRALSTYKPNTDAWLDVFRAFRHLIEQNTVRPGWPRPRPRSRGCRTPRSGSCRRRPACRDDAPPIHPILIVQITVVPYQYGRCQVVPCALSTAPLALTTKS